MASSEFVASHIACAIMEQVYRFFRPLPQASWPVICPRLLHLNARSCQIGDDEVRRMQTFCFCCICRNTSASITSFLFALQSMTSARRVPHTRDSLVPETVAHVDSARDRRRTA